MMVLSAIMIISTVILEFVYSSNVNYRLAVNERERLQAYYLAESALNLMKVEMKIDKQLRSTISSTPFAQNLPIDLSQPLCQQFPFSTALIRGFFIGGQVPLMGGTEAPPEGEGAVPEGEAPKMEEPEGSGSVFEKEDAEKFLSFEGDFDGQCSDEQSKFSLNYFAVSDPAQQVLSGLNPYDTYKATLANFIKNPRFKKLFGDNSQQKIDEIVRNIADYVDKDDLINDAGNVTRGPEIGAYKDAAEGVKPKNSKLLTLDEVHMIEGVDDTWFMPLEDMFTVYGENKVNICRAGDDVVWSLILAYAGQNPNAPPVNPENKEAKQKLLYEVRMSCSAVQPQTAKIASDLDAALGITPNTQPSSEQPQQAKPSSNFASMITAESRYYSLKLTGQVGETMVNVKVVLDIKDSDPRKWKTLYYKIY